MLIGLYRTKAELEHSIGEPLHAADDTVLGHEIGRVATVAVRGCDPDGDGRPWTAEVTLVGGRIVRVD